MGTEAPLKGVRVLDLTNVLAGPFACHQLAHLGAEVIKVEAPGRGDLARNLGADPQYSAKGMGISFLAQNAGKASITLNLKSTKGVEVLKHLVGSADVLVENFRPGVMDRLGVGYKSLSEVNPSLVYCAISGFGQTGPWADRPAYDQIVQGISGVMSVTGTEASGPTRVGYPMADTVGGLTAAMVISAALTADEPGAFIDVSMLEAVLSTMGWVASNHLIGGVSPGRNGNENPTSAPSGTFQCADGLINISANKDEQWVSLAHELKREDLLNDPDFQTREARKSNRLRLKAELETALTRAPAATWVDRLNACGVPAGEVLTVPEVLAHPQISDRDFLGHFETVPNLNTSIDLIRIGAMIDGSRPSVNTPPPALGADTNRILLAAGYSKEDISLMRKDGVI